MAFAGRGQRGFQASDRRFPWEIPLMQCIGKTPANFCDLKCPTVLCCPLSGMDAVLSGHLDGRRDRNYAARPVEANGRMPAQKLSVNKRVEWLAGGHRGRLV